MRHTAALLIAFLLILSVDLQSAKSQIVFSIYCSSNMDGTGKCRKVDGDDEISCIIIPGGVVACKDTEKKKYECVQYGAITANQTQFACEVDADNSVNDQLFEANMPKTEDRTSIPSVEELPPASEQSMPNPFQSGPSPDINDNDFPSVF
jgi:hypothetical protein